MRVNPLGWESDADGARCGSVRSLPRVEPNMANIREDERSLRAARDSVRDGYIPFGNSQQMESTMDQAQRGHTLVSSKLHEARS